MAPAYLTFMKKKAASIDDRYDASWGRQYDHVSIDDCPRATPECLFYQCLHTPKAYRKCCVEHKRLRDVGWFVMDSLEKQGIRYFLSTGTALGSYRHNGTIIPWDTDVDMAIFPSDKERVRSIFSATSDRHRFHTDQLGKGMFWVHYAPGVGADEPSDGPHVELFFESDYTKHASKLLPLTPCEWYGRSTWCPQRAMLDHWFRGSGWQSYSGCHYHSDGRSTDYTSTGRKEVRKC